MYRDRASRAWPVSISVSLGLGVNEYWSRVQLTSYSFFILVQLVQTLINKRFKLGATTTFLTRSLANYDYMK
ncbi:unnamed protein product [Rotaria sp. Silwood1]|nr:unnamed protein product [Rotaria sp. Silwood1]